MNKFGELIRTKKEEKKMLLRHLGAELDIDTALLSKMERGEKVTKREQVEKLIKIFELDSKKAKAFWLADQIYAIINAEDEVISALHMVKQDILRLHKSKRN